MNMLVAYSLGSSKFLSGLLVVQSSVAVLQKVQDSCDCSIELLHITSLLRDIKDAYVFMQATLCYV